MGTEGTKASLAGSNESPAEEKVERKPAPRTGEGVGVFRALLIMALFYVVFGLLIGLAWYAFQHWRGR
jgi:hypothetical protein